MLIYGAYSLVYDVVDLEDFVEKVVVKASQNSTNNSNYYNRDNVHHMVTYRNTAYIKHD